MLGFCDQPICYKMHGLTKYFGFMQVIEKKESVFESGAE